jgi:putative zinc finger/helix-turn-helix YgiT family protein
LDSLGRGAVARMKHICPICEKVTECSKHDIQETYTIKGEEVSVTVNYFTCNECNGKFEKSGEGEDYLRLAYNKYRQLHDMIQPEVIVNFRKSYNLTQKELGGLLGWGGATLSRYENGALQDTTHDKMLKLIMKPDNLLSLINSQHGVLDHGKKEKLIELLEKQLEDTCSFNSIISNRLADYQPSIASGFKRFDFNKFSQAILFFTKEKVFKSKLCKLMFYADFKYYKENAISITGSKYAHGFHGPIPDNFEILFATLLHENKIKAEEKDFGNYIGELYQSKQDANLGVFSNDEIETLVNIKSHFKDFTATQIRELSHKEKGYEDTIDGQIINYDYANALSI